MAHVDPGAGDRLAVGVEHAAADREGPGRVEGSGFALRAGGLGSRPAVATGAVAAFGAPRPSETRAADAPHAIRPAASRAADADRQLLDNMILSTS